MTFDVLGSLALILYALILGPLGILRGPIAFERLGLYLWVLAPQGLLTRSIRAAVDWRLGHFDSAIAQIEGLISANEEYYKKRPEARVRRRVLEDFFTLLARAYLHAGHIDDAMLVVIRAKKSLAIERLPGLAELDAKTAHLVRAGLAAGRLLDGGGLATMFVKANATPKPAGERAGAIPGVPGAPLPPTGAPPPRAGASPGAGKRRDQSRAGQARPSYPSVGGQASTTPPSAKIIPFPPPPPQPV